MSEVSKTNPRFGGFTELSIYLYSWLGFVIIEGHKSKSAKGKKTWSKVPRELLRVLA